MNYEAVYSRIMERAQGRTLDGYSEKHHIIPRCMGGAQSPVVRLTPEEHYVAHQLLVKMYPTNHRLLWAAMNMTGATKKMVGRKNKLYGWLRRRFSVMLSERMRGRVISAEAREKMRAAKLGKKRDPHTPETKAKMRAASLGRKKSAEHCAAIGAAKRGAKYPPRSAESRRRSSVALKKAMSKVDFSYMQKPEYREKRRKQMIEIWQRRHAGESSMHNPKLS